MLVERIRSGQLTAGTQLPTESALMAQPGVSRPAVREALSQLQRTLRALPGLSERGSAFEWKGRPVLGVQAEGDAITFICPSDHTALETIERALGRNLPRAEWEDAPPVLSLFPPKETVKAKAGPRRPVRRLLRRR